MMFNEDNTIEPFVISSLEQIGWEYISAKDLDREFNDVLVESMLKESLCKLNPTLSERPDFADEVIYRIRALISTTRNDNLITSNEKFFKLLFENNSFPFGENGRFISIDFFDFFDLSNNTFVVTNQWVFPREKGGKRFDVVLLINGIPFVIGELKTPVRSSITWLDGAIDINAYEKSVPSMFTTNLLNFASEGKMFRYGSIGMSASLWGPWHSVSKKEGTLQDVGRSIKSIFKLDIVMDILRHFTLFATNKRFKKIKLIARYQQYEGVNKIVERVLNGYPKKGLLWHFQGSGKSLLMVLAAQKLRFHKKLKNPTIVIVVDRIDLDTQISATFNASDIPNMYSANSKNDLIDFFKKDIRKIMITTIFKFGEVESLLNERDNIVVLVDEAHRTQEGDLGVKMRHALPNAFFFGLTGTPINRSDRNTYWAFGSEEDEHGYMSKYSFSDSIRDNATLPLHFEAVHIDLDIDSNKIDEEFNNITEGLSTKDKSEITKRIRMEAIIKTPDRIRSICEFITEHYKNKVQPNGFKAQLVTYDRECCVLYKQELDELIGEEKSAIVMHTAGDKSDEYSKYKLSKDDESKLLDSFRDPFDPLSILIVTSKLLTGFDAPILQTMYLDKPMKDHTLLQAICRTNRLYDNKTHGLIVDFLGIFDNVASSLSFDDTTVHNVISNIEELKLQLPVMIEEALTYFRGLDRSIEGYEGLLLAQEYLKDDNTKDEFALKVSNLSKVWEAISPDKILSDYKKDYIWITKVYESIKPISNQGKLVWHALGSKTIDLVHESIEVNELVADVDPLVISADMIEELINSKNPDEQARKIEIHISRRLRKYSDNPKFTKLGEKLERLKEAHENGQISSIEFLKSLLQIAKATVECEKEVSTVQEKNQAKNALTELFNEVKNEDTPIIVERIVNDIDDIVTKVRFPGWQTTAEGERLIKKELRKIMYLKYKINDLELYEKAYSYIKIYY